MEGCVPGDPGCQAESKRLPVRALLIVRLTFLLHGRLELSSVCFVHASVHVVNVSDVVQRGVISSSQLVSPASRSSRTVTAINPNVVCDTCVQAKQPVGMPGLAW